MTFSGKKSYDRIFRQVTHKGWESSMNYIKIFQNAQDLSVSVGNTYSEDQLIHTFLDNSHQGGKYFSKISSHQEELWREETFIDETIFSIITLHTDYLSLDSRSGCGRNSERANIVQTKSTFLGGANYSAVFFPKESERKRKNIVWLVIQTTDKRNVRLGNVLDVDVKIT